MRSQGQTARVLSDVRKAKASHNESGTIQVFVKLLNKGLRSSDYTKFPFRIQEGASLRDLIGYLIKEHSARFEIYLDDTRNRMFCNDTIILVNGRMVLAGWKLKMGYVAQEVLDILLQNGDTVVFMIMTGGGSSHERAS
ncbi:MAG: MoaD/ThiS family protein [Candidatus Thorarchaeota archaeon]